MFAQVGSELSTRVLRSAVGMKHRTRSKLDLGRGHGERVTEQVVAHMIGHRPAHNRLGVTVDHRGQVEPPSPGTDVRNVPYEPGPWGRSGEVTWEEHTSELQSLRHLVCRLLLEKK